MVMDLGIWLLFCAGKYRECKTKNEKLGKRTGVEGDFLQTP